MEIAISLLIVVLILATGLLYHATTLLINKVEKLEERVEELENDQIQFEVLSPAELEEVLQSPKIQLL